VNLVAGQCVRKRHGIAVFMLYDIICYRNFIGRAVIISYFHALYSVGQQGRYAHDALGATDSDYAFIFHLGGRSANTSASVPSEMRDAVFCSST